MFNPINDTLERIRRVYIPLLGRLVSAYNDEARGRNKIALIPHTKRFSPIRRSIR